MIIPEGNHYGCDWTLDHNQDWENPQRSAWRKIKIGERGKSTSNPITIVGITECRSWWGSSFAKRLEEFSINVAGGTKTLCNVLYRSLFFLGRMEMKRSFIRRTKALLVYWPCVLVFQMPIPLSVGADLMAGQTGECGLSIGRLDWAADLRWYEVSDHAGLFMLGIFDDHLASLDWQLNGGARKTNQDSSA